MTTAPIARRAGYGHEAALYGSDGEFLDMVLPFLREGIEAGEPTVAALPSHETELVRTALGNDTRVDFLDADEQYVKPASTIEAFRNLFATYTDEGAKQIRALGAVPCDATWPWWARYEAAINHLYEDFQAWCLCLHDARGMPAERRDDVRRTHRYLTSSNGRPVASDEFQEPAEFLARPSGGADPLEAQPPAAELVDPTPDRARRAAHEVSRATRCSDDEVSDFVFAVNEAVTNAICHGRSPARLRLWSAPDRLVTTVTDSGFGPSDPVVGLRHANSKASGGVGLWVAHQMCSYITFDTDDDGFTIRMAVGRPRVS